jgi:hypothetical protein
MVSVKSLLGINTVPWMHIGDLKVKLCALLVFALDGSEWLYPLEKLPLVRTE